MERLKAARVAIFGLGGVGGYTAEALARSGIGTFDLIDDDKVCLTNLNRQIIATQKTIGKYKVDVMKERMQEINPDMNSFDKLIYLNHELFLMIENSVPMDLLAQMYSSQLITFGDRHLMNQGRTYYRVLRKIVIEGQKRGQLRTDVSVNEIVKAYAMLERAMIYDWCLCNGDYSLYQYSGTTLPMFLNAYKSTALP